MQGDIYRLSTVECDGWQILIKERFEHNDFFSMFQESREDGVLPCASWLVSNVPKRCQEILAFISPTCDNDLRINVKVSVELGAIEVLDCVAQTRTPSRMRIMIRSHNIESFFRGNRDPFGRRKVHIPLTEV
jgi:hypothetical protein